MKIARTYHAVWPMHNHFWCCYYARVCCCNRTQMSRTETFEANVMSYGRPFALTLLDSTAGSSLCIWQLSNRKIVYMVVHGVIHTNENEYSGLTMMWLCCCRWPECQHWWRWCACQLSWHLWHLFFAFCCLFFIIICFFFCLFFFFVLLFFVLCSSLFVLLVLFLLHLIGGLRSPVMAVGDLLCEHWTCVCAWVTSGCLIWKALILVCIIDPRGLLSRRSWIHWLWLGLG